MVKKTKKVESNDMEGRLAEATLRSIKTSPIKLAAVARAIQGMPVSEATMRLRFSNRPIAREVNKLLKSAMTNAENNHGLDIDNLIVYRVDIGKAMVLRRFKPRAKGRGCRILKPFSRIRIVLIEKKGEE